MDPIETITKPWRNPIAYGELLLWVVIFVIFAAIVYDGVKLFAIGLKTSANAAVDAVAS